MSERERTDERLGAYLDGELGAAERAALEREIDARPDLRARVDELRALRRVLRSVPEIDFARDRLPDLMRAIGAAEVPSPTPWRAVGPTWRERFAAWWTAAPLWQPAAAVAASAVLAAGLWLYAEDGRVSERQFAHLAPEWELYENWDVIGDLDVLEDYEAILRLDQMEG